MENRRQTFKLKDGDGVVFSDLTGKRNGGAARGRVKGPRAAARVRLLFLHCPEGPRYSHPLGLRDATPARAGANSADLTDHLRTVVLRGA